MSRFRVYDEATRLANLRMMCASGFEHACAHVPFRQWRLRLAAKLKLAKMFLMDTATHGGAAEWRYVLALWIAPPLIIQIVLILLVAGYVRYPGAN